MSNGIDWKAGKAALDQMDSGLWTRGGHSHKELIEAIVKSALGCDYRGELSPAVYKYAKRRSREIQSGKE